MVEYPQIIEHLILFLGTGMSVVAALEAVATEYEKEQRRGNKKKSSYMNRSKKHADRFHLEFHRQKHLVRWAKDWVVFLSKIICSARTEYYKRFNGSVSKVKRRGRRSFFEKKNMQKGKENKQAQNCSHR